MPIVRTDARNADEALDTLVQLLSHILTTLSAKAAEEIAASPQSASAAAGPEHRPAPVVTNDMRSAAMSALAAERGSVG